MSKKIRTSIPDTGRFKRQGFPEAIYAPGKTKEEIIEIAGRLMKGGGPVIATRIENSLAAALARRFKNAKYYKKAKILLFNGAEKHRTGRKYVCVVTAGTTDIGVAEEAAVTLEVLGNRVERIYDAGVSGIHRIFAFKDKLEGASCVIVCAGMEGALASVVGGVAPCPVIGVPTSVGYGANFGGIAALLTMLNSCAANVTVVNINDGFGAGVVAGLINNAGK